ncbi:MAG: hypothetical protein ACRD4H_09510 [Candidatus Acidiferrales bacterium]
MGSFASGVQLQLFGQDKNQTQLFAVVFAVNPDITRAAVGEDNPADGHNGTINDGTDKELDATYAITGGPCDGLGGSDETFMLIRKHHGHDTKAARAMDAHEKTHP